jgi:hypothetical protein
MWTGSRATTTHARTKAKLTMPVAAKWLLRRRQSRLTSSATVEPQVVPQWCVANPNSAEGA